MDRSFELNIIASLGLISLAAPALAQDAFTCPGESVCRFDDTRLPVKVLTRPAASVLDAAAEGATELRSNLPPFRPWYVYASEGVDLTDPEDPKGFFQVGFERDSGPFGWLPAGDAMLWRSSIVVTYAPRGAGAEEDQRSRVFMFSELDDVKAIMDGGDPAGDVSGLSDALSARDLDALGEAGVVMAEPTREVDFQTGFYILPVIEYEILPLGLDEEARYLRVAAAIPQAEDSLSRGPSTVTDGDTLTNIEEGDAGSLDELQQAADAKIDIVFAIDMTGSMQPYLDATRESVSRILTRVDDLDLPVDVVRYGLVGYTDEPSNCGECGFDYANNFTPDLVGHEDLRRILADDRRARANDGGDWPETVFAGVAEAAQSNWRENSLKFLITIGDAESKSIGSDGAPLTAESAKSLAETGAGDSEINVIALHARPAGLPSESNATAEEQFRTLSARSNGQGANYFGIDVDPRNAASIENAFLSANNQVADVLLLAIKALRTGDADTLVGLTEGGAEDGAAPSSAADVARAAVADALVEYLGTAAVRPNDLTAWTLDVDPADTFINTLDVRVLLEKRELSDLVAAMEDLLAAYKRAELLGSDLFAEIQSTVVSASTDEGASADAGADLRTSGLGPSWLSSLPYRSAIMELTPESFANMDVDQRENFELDLEDKLGLLKDYVNDPDIWVKMSPDVGELSAVFPVPLLDLP